MLNGRQHKGWFAKVLKKNNPHEQILTRSVTLFSFELVKSFLNFMVTMDQRTMWDFEWFLIGMNQQRGVYLSLPLGLKSTQAFFLNLLFWSSSEQRLLSENYFYQLQPALVFWFSAKRLLAAAQRPARDDKGSSQTLVENKMKLKDERSRLLDATQMNADVAQRSQVGQKIN